MLKPVVFVLAIAFIMNACIPLPFTAQPTPVVETGVTDVSQAETMAAETFNALPTPTPAPATDTPPPSATHTESPSATTEPATLTLTSDPNAMPSVTGKTTVTAVTSTVTTTGTVATSLPVNATATETLHPRFYGTLPPAIPFGKVTLVNRAKADVYVSLQCTTVDGYKTIIEYPVFGRLNVSAPAGSYNYVAWVGGRQFQGSFHLSKGEDLSITFNKDKVTVK